MLGRPAHPDVADGDHLQRARAVLHHGLAREPPAPGALAPPRPPLRRAVELAAPGDARGGPPEEVQVLVSGADRPR